MNGFQLVAVVAVSFSAGLLVGWSLYGLPERFRAFVARRFEEGDKQ